MGQKRGPLGLNQGDMGKKDNLYFIFRALFSTRDIYFKPALGIFDLKLYSENPFFVYKFGGHGRKYFLCSPKSKIIAQSCL